MKSSLFPSVLRSRNMRLLRICLFLLLPLTNSLNAQTLIDPFGDGGFDNGPDFASNGWTVVNTPGSPNEWKVMFNFFLGTVAGITKDGGTTIVYDTTKPTMVHFYRDVTFPQGVPSFTLSFSGFIGGGGTNWDEVLVSLAPISYTPVAGTTETQSTLPAPAIHLGRFQNISTTQTINIPSDLVGNCLNNSKRRLIFTWKNGFKRSTPSFVGIRDIELKGNPLMISHPADQCEAGNNITYTVSYTPGPGEKAVYRSSPTNYMLNYTVFPLFGVLPPPFPQTPNTGTFLAANAPPGEYEVLYSVTTPGCVFEVFDTIVIKDIPTADLEDRFLDCLDPGEVIDLDIMLNEDGETTPGGAWSVAGATLDNGQELAVPATSTCFSVTYSVDNECGPPATVTKKLLTLLGADPLFTINGSTADILDCQNTSSNLTYNIQRTSNGDNPRWTVLKGEQVISNSLTASGGALTIPPPGENESVCYTICLDEDGASSDCSPGILPDDYDPCVTRYCLSIIVYNDGNCDNGSITSNIFPSECGPNLFNPTYDICVSKPSPTLVFSCIFIKKKIPFKILNARLETDQCALFCDSTEFTIRYRADNLFNQIPGFNVKLRSLDPSLNALCKIINFCICVPDIVSYRPLKSLAGWCDVSLATLVSEAVERYAGSRAGSGGLVVADTDGDGNFDNLIADYRQVPWPVSGNNYITGVVPNNMDKKGGIITVRHVTGWPFRADYTCGVPTSGYFSLLDALKPFIEKIPIAGPVINSILTTLKCDIPLVFSDTKDLRIPVINSSLPEFKNCPPTGYVFTENSSCTTAANWSIPVVEDGCYGGVLPYVGRLDTTIVSYFNGTPPPTFVVKDSGSGLYQTQGPIVGSVLPPGVYPVTYSAFSCRGVRSDCSFNITVTSGEPQLICPEDVVIPNDVDQCSAVVMGLTPRGGLGCATVLNYQITFPVSSGLPPVGTSTDYNSNTLGTINDVSGRTFPVGTSQVTYILKVDLNGDGDADDQSETQSCTFSVTVLDVQRPHAVCIDREIKLDQTGNATIYAEDQGGGSIFMDGGSTDNCDADPLIEIQKPGQPYSASQSYNCVDVGDNLLNLRIFDDAGNYSTCIARIKVIDYLDGIQINLNLPELCLEANNPSQLDFANYLTITMPNGESVNHNNISTHPYLSGSQGYFFIQSFLPDSTSTTDPGSISYDGVYTPGTGHGFITFSYLLFAPGFVPSPDSLPPYFGCHKIINVNFELRQPLEMGSPECECLDGEERIVDLGVVTGGLEPYRIQYTGVRLDVDGDGTADDYDGEYTYDVIHGHEIGDAQEDLGELRVVYTIPVWSFTVVDARGCEIFRSGSCDNDDLLVGPSITCPPSNYTLTTEEWLCESQYSWTHPLPTDNCGVTLYDYRIQNPDGTVEGPFTLDALLNTAPNAPLPQFFTATYEFQQGLSTITYYAEDAQGNFINCSFEVNVTDDDPPHFLNCNEPPVIQNAESGHCDAYVTFAQPLVTDNCDVPVPLTKIDNTGLNSGSRFPVGTTILYWETVDLTGNKDTCQVKIIVNDYWQDPILSCPANVVKNNDPWLCGAVVNNIAPAVSGPCKDNYGVTYTIYADAALTQVKDCGVTNASGEFFDTGDSWVKYTVSNQPLLLITEVGQSGGVDRLEITNLGPADIDISCLEIRRVSGNAAANQTIGPVTLLPSLAPSMLNVGAPRVFNFSFNAPANLPACYTISYVGTVFDQVSTNGYAGCAGFSGVLNGGDVIRKCEDDTNTAADWVLAENCYPLTFGAVNPDLEVMPDNGTQTSLQSIEPNKVSCTFKVTVNDAENPFCGKLSSPTVYNGAGIPNISAATCNRSTITIPAGNCIIGDIVFNRTGTATPANSVMTLISPKGIKVVLTEIPDDSLSTLFGQKAEGNWILDVVPLPGQNPTVTGWSLTIRCIAPFDLPDQVLNNAPGQCGQNFTWIHPLLVDNCFQGTITVTYTSADADCVPASGPILGIGGYSTTQFFCVGTTKVTYTLKDAAGNTAQCDFDVTVKDVEQPQLSCPANLTINLNGGECGKYVSYGPALSVDNCAVTDTVMTPVSGSWFDIGTHVVTIWVTDEAGNTKTCTFSVNIVEYVPGPGGLVCNDLSHVSMPADCNFVLDADGALEGSNYHCYSDYVITVKNQQGQPVDNNFDASDIGKTFTVTVLDPETGNSCWSTLTIEDKLKPALVCPANITIACSEPTAVSYTGDVLIDDCSATTKVVDNEILDNGECGNPRQIITRSFIVTDVWGNQSVCSQTITVVPFDLDDVVMPDDVIVNCEAVYLNAAATAPDNTGRPSINGAPIGVGGLCSASIGYTDEVLAICEGSYEILRTWKVRNTCLPISAANPVEHVQIIRVKDLGGPQFACPPAVTVSTDPFNCCATAALPDMIVSEGCSDIGNLEAKVTGVNPANGNIITFTVPGYLADFPGNNYWNPDTLAVFDYTQCLPLGNYTVRYTASDECGNTSSCQFVLTVADLVPPVAVCQQVTQVDLGGSGVSLVDASSFDSGSDDNCSPVEFKVRRMLSNTCQSDSTFHDQVRFCCDDVNDTITVVFRAYDIDVPSGEVALDAYAGHYNDCMVQVFVADKIKPVCTPPANATVDCENFDPSLWAYGMATGQDNCCLDTITVQNSYTQFDTVCNRGTITRTFRAFDCGGQSSQCTQRVFVNYIQDYFVRFPNDVIVTVCDGTGNYGEPQFFGEDCELLGVSSEDEIFTVVPDACFKIERSWTVINWCTFNPNLPVTLVPNPNPNANTNSSQNLPGPIVSAPGTPAPWAPTSVAVLPGQAATNYSVFYHGGQYNGTTIPNIANNNCFTYKQVIKVIDTQAPTANCPASPVEFCDLTVNNPQLWNE
ncbi:MAG: HYR domain-containing protein, partial [Saprospiraceae bacterium]|nr:HYR domain-containing protein [Saprospiraceae bacterium]